MSCLVCCLEEPSAREMLKGILPRLLGTEVEVFYIVFEGKSDLEKQLERRMQFWQKPNSVFLVMRDQDSGDCKTIKTRLQAKIKATQKAEKTIIRIACRELESFYLGDLKAVQAAYAIKNLAKKQNQSKYRNPDRLGNPAQERYNLTQRKYQKVSGSRKISPYLGLCGENCSPSFSSLLAGIATTNA